MKPLNNRRCPWILCLCGVCSGIPRVKRVKQVPLRGELVTMTPGQYRQYREVQQIEAWAGRLHELASVRGMARR